jgi:CRP-like cAMP-binding protein
VSSGVSRLDRVFSRFGRAGSPPAAAPPADLRPLVARLDALEAMVEGLQDSVDREARRHEERLSELARRLEPGELARTLSEDARRRGL